MGGNLMGGNLTGGGLMGLSPATWAKIAIIAALFAATFRYNLVRLWLKTAPFIGEPNWSHSFLVPLVGLYFLFVHREELLAADGKPVIWDRFTRPGRLYAGLGMMAVGAGVYFGARTQQGNMFSMIQSAGEAVAVLGTLALLLDWAIGTTIFGLVVFVYGIYPGQNDYLKDMGMIATLFGIVLLTGGRQVMRIAWFPIVFLVCAIPWPGLVYSWVSTPLSQAAAWVAVQVMKLTGVNCLVLGTKIVINNIGKPQRVLNVEEACAGLRSLMTYVSMGAAIAFLSSRALWQKLGIVISTIPIAIACNMLRISVVGELDRVNTNWSDGVAHQFVGLLMLIPAFLMLLTVIWVLDRIVIEEADETDLKPAAAAAVPGIVVKKAPVILRKPTADAANAGAVTAPRPETVIPAPKVAMAASAASVVAPAVRAGVAVQKPVQAAAAVTSPAKPMPVAAKTAVSAVPSATAPKAPVAGPAAAPVAPRSAAPTAPAVKPAAPTMKPAVAAAVPPRTAGGVPPRPAAVRPPAAGTPTATVPRTPASPAGTVPPRPAGIVPPRPATPANPGPSKTVPANPPPANPAAVKAPGGPVVPPRPAGARPIVPPRPPQPVAPPKPPQETP